MNVNLKKQLKHIGATFKYATVEPVYLFFVLTDLVWGLGVLFGGGYQPLNPEFAILNTYVFGLLLTGLGIGGMIVSVFENFMFRATHSWFNIMFFSFISVIFWEQGDSCSAARNTMSVFLAVWVTWRIQFTHARAVDLSKDRP